MVDKPLNLGPEYGWGSAPNECHALYIDKFVESVDKNTSLI